MKKSLIAIAVVSCLSGLANAADALNYEIRVVKKEGDVTKTIEQVSLMTTLNVPAPYSQTNTITYLAEVITRPDGAIEMIPATVRTGFTGVVRPVAINTDSSEVETDVGVALSDLSGMETTMVGGEPVQHPITRTLLPNGGIADTTIQGGHTFSLVRGAAPTMVAQGADGIEVFVALK